MDSIEVYKLTRTVNAECPEPTNIVRLDKYNPDKNRPVKVKVRFKETAVSILRNRINLKSDTNKLYYDQTPQ